LFVCGSTGFMSICAAWRDSVGSTAITIAPP
jgi:hypothetical protein